MVGPADGGAVERRGEATEVVAEESVESLKERQRRERREKREEKLLKTASRLKTAKVRYKVVCDVHDYSPSAMEVDGLFI